MCDIDRTIEVLFIFGLIGAFIVFVIGINWWNVRDARKQFDRMYGKSK